MATKEKTKSSTKLSRAHIFFLVAGLLLLVRFLVNGGVPSLNDPLKFLVGIFELILIIGFYVFFLVGAKSCSGTLRAFAPALLLIIIDGQYSSAAFFIPRSDLPTGRKSWYTITEKRTEMKG